MIERDFGEKLCPLGRIKIEYPDGDPNKSLLIIDGGKLEKTMRDIGYPPNIRIIRIEEKGGTYAIGLFNRFTGVLTIYQGTLRNIMYKLHNEVREKIEKQKTPPEPQTCRSIADLLLIIYAPPIIYRSLKDPYPYDFAGNPERREKYLRRAKEGTLQPGKSPEEQKQRALEFMRNQEKRVWARCLAHILAHEIEHSRHPFLRDFVTIFNLGTAPHILGIIATAIIAQHFERLNFPQSKISLIEYLGYGVSQIFSLAGILKGKIITEQRAENAARKYMEKIRECFQINPKVFMEILREPSDPPSSQSPGDPDTAQKSFVF